MAAGVEIPNQQTTGGRPATDQDAPVWHTLSVQEVLGRLEVVQKQGLSDEEVEKRLARYGPNELASTGGIQPWQILLKQFLEPLVLVLIAAAVVAFLLWLVEGQGHEPLPYDSIVIMAIVLLNGLLGFIQEFRAERAVEALKQMAAPECQVRRNGRTKSVATQELVPGDILLLVGGERIPADARLLQTANLDVEEAALTGESVPVHKQPQPLEQPRAELAERKNMVYMGTVVTYGRGEAAVVATGMQTQMGSIATLLESVEQENTPLQRELAVVGKQLGILVLAICLVVAVTGLLREGSFSTDILIAMFLFGVALAVAAIPEGLPAIVTAELALGVRRMAEQNAIVRRLPAVETLGSATIICSDKTGTLTRNQMAVRKILLGLDQVIDVEGNGEGVAETFHRTQETPLAGADDLVHLLRIAALNNDASLNKTENGRWSFQGDPTEGALLVAARQAGLDEEQLAKTNPRQGEIPFSSERKRMTTIHSANGQPEGEQVAYVKGAPEIIAEYCNRIRVDGEVLPLTGERRQQILAHNETFAQNALRTLAFATRNMPADAQDTSGNYRPDLVETDLIWEGLIGMIDPPRPEARKSVELARRAGIRTIMITGDHALTALAIARELDIAGPDDASITGRQLSEMDDAELARQVLEVDVYARVNPEHKLRIVKALKKHGHTVAMTGDGVNDAPALKQADIGVAMGITGTDVSKEASEMVLADDNFATIVTAIAEGRMIFDNIRKFIRYLLSSNAGEVLTMFVAIIAATILGLHSGDGGFFLPLLAVQILWINLVTDGGPALALGVDPAGPDLMSRPPRRPDERVIDLAMWGMIGVVGVVMMAGTLFVLDAYLPGGLTTLVQLQGDSEYMARHARTAAFTTLVLFQMFNVFNCRSQNLSIFRIGPFKNRWLLAAVAISIALQVLVIYWAPLQAAFDLVPLTLFDWLLATAVASTVLIVTELIKLTPWLKE